ncbi:uncharacterized protein LOC115089493 isoform X1 [Rhinatrema bivittatum]|uniref:uncharacterized protein LOC115089493 isoform X1 n=1 Tax=Rhinatrema bivittatum TaxID=194408 RepID=UPI00112A1840|nr:uncharacterized protein LOC115089493 isoform X1 [Rhinatrema bivittatum]XP_029453434.1 uncharacterized protein LOC115089493 isoform X1 [Rhinatrema bivittatum]
MAEASKISLAEREFLYKDKELEATGFSPKSTQKFMLEVAPWIDTKLEVQRRLRSPWDSYQPTLKYQNWPVITSLPSLFSPRPNKRHGSRMSHRFSTNQQGKDKLLPKITRKATHFETHYLIPAPSRVTDFSFTKMSSKSLVLDEKLKVQVISRALKELEESNKLKLKRESHIPLLDHLGNVLLPKDFNRDRRFMLHRQETGGWRSRDAAALNKSGRRHCKIDINRGQRVEDHTGTPSLDPSRYPRPGPLPFHPAFVHISNPDSGICASQYMRTPRKLTLQNNSPVYWQLLSKYQGLHCPMKAIMHSSVWNTPVPLRS